MKKTLTSNFKKIIINTIARFPFTILYSFALSAILIFLISNGDNDYENLYLISNTLFTGIIFSILVTIISEVLKNKKILIFGNIILIGLLLLFYFFYPIGGPNKFIYKNIIIDLIGILAITVAPFFSKDKQREFWFYNSKIIFKLIITSVYTGVIIAGISIAFGTITALIGADIEPEIYLDFSVFTIGIFGAIFFLANFPKNYNDDLQDFEYPKAIKILVFYILLPLTTLYFAILYFYFIKILMQWHIPSGSVSYMILIFSILGIFALMSVYPLKSSEKHKGIAIFSKFFFWAVLPLIILLFVSIFIRIKDYGITENRYYVISFAIWLSGISIYMLKTKLNNIKIIPISLFFVIILTSFGPWSAFNVSKKNQLKILDKILVENNIIPVNNNTDSVMVQDSIYDIIYNITDYIIENHGSSVLAEKYQFHLAADDDSLIYSNTNSFLDSLKIRASIANYKSEYFSIYNNFELINVKNYDYYINNFSTYRDENYTDSLKISFEHKSMIIKLTINNNEIEYDINQQMNALVEKKLNNKELSSKDFEILLPEKENIKVKLIIANFSGDFIDNKAENYSLTFGILIKK